MTASGRGRARAAAKDSERACSRRDSARGRPVGVVTGSARRSARTETEMRSGSSSLATRSTVLNSVRVILGASAAARAAARAECCLCAAAAEGGRVCVRVCGRRIGSRRRWSRRGAAA